MPTANKAKWVRVLTAGATADNRNVPNNHILEMAAAYNPAVFTARINLEHITWAWTDGEFKRYGSVLALKAEKITDVEPLNGKLALYALLDPIEELIEITNIKKQKIFTSVEYVENFASTGKAYLTGIAMTDDPASLGTEAVKFTQQKSEKNQLETAFQECQFFSTTPEKTEPQTQTQPQNQEENMNKNDFLIKMSQIFEAALAPFKAQAQAANTLTAMQTAQTAPEAENQNDPQFANIIAGVEKLTNALTAAHATAEKQTAENGALLEKLTQQEAQMKDLETQFTALKTEHQSFKTEIENTPASQYRQSATGAQKPDEYV